MTALRRLWPDAYTAAVVRKFSPGMLAELAAWFLALAGCLVRLLAPVMAAPVVRQLALVPVPDGPAVAWSAPAGADWMRTGPPCLAWETPLGAGWT